jgi:predicted O-linked N-acetylglucosamine transferase (SPINDLY family)
MQDKQEIFNKALQLQMKGKFDKAQKIYLKLISENISNDKLFFFTGTSFLQTNDYDKAIKFLDKSIKLNPDIPEAYNNKGIALKKIEKYSESVENYDKAISLKKDYVDAYLNKGISLRIIKKYKEAINCFETCIKLKPKEPKIYNNLGNVYGEIKNFNIAVECYSKALQLNKNFGEAYSNRGRILHRFDHHKLALDDFEKAYKNDNNLDYIVGDLFFTKMHFCNWEDFYKFKEQIENGINNKKKIMVPFPMLLLNDDQNQHKIVAEQHAKEQISQISNFPRMFHKKNDKIRIGYFSPDFKNHPVMHLILDVLKNHDKSKFDIYGFYHGPKEDKWTDNVKEYFHKFYNVYKKSEEDIATLSRENKIDIAVDLCGYTKFSIPKTYIKGAAPIQINYLGYPGTMGNKYHNYIIADKNIIPQSELKNFSEKVLYLPNCYQANQSKIKISNKNFNKKDFKLPDESFVFACLNSNYKINPIIFDSWMKILIGCKNSVLWLLKGNEQSAENLIKEASKRGVDKNRIIFAEQTSLDIHLKRMQFIDLFLDTHPYGAHTTASEVIRMGVPIITIMGNSFASRVATSILKNVGLENLITKNIEEYTNTSIDFGLNKNKILDIKNYLSDPSNTEILYNSKKFTKDLENIFQNLIKI